MTIAKCNRGGDNMRIKVLLVAPYRGLKELALTLTQKHPNLDIIVKEADLSVAIPLIKFYEQQNIQFIISRGGTARLIKQYTDIPVIEIRVSGYDIIRALTLVKDYKMKVKMIGFPNICRDVLSIAHLLNIEIDYTIINHEDEVEDAVRSAQFEGAQVLLGDTITVNTAQKYGLQGMMITSGKESVLEAFEQVLEMAGMMEYMEKRNTVYQSFISDYRDGIALFDDNGHLIFNNRSFSSLLEKEGLEHDGIALDLHPEISIIIKKLIDLKEDNTMPSELVTINGVTMTFNGGRFYSGNTIYLYLSTHKDRSDKETETSLRIYRNHLFPTSFAQMVTSSPVMVDVLTQAKKLAKTTDAIIVYGEKGTGKGFISNSIHNASEMRDGDFLEIELKKANETNLSKVENIINDIKKGTIYFKGLEHLPDDDQQQMVDLLNEKRHIRFIFAINQNSMETHVSKLISKKLTAKRLWIPPLRDRMEDLEELIRLFITTYNTKYGKQIVGIRHEVLDTLYKNEWSENVTELKKTVKELVKIADSDYLEKSHLKVIESINNEKKQLTTPINLSKTLEEIEKDIIAFVLEEEDMNQTKAANRLGINRTTLWRKLKT